MTPTTCQDRPRPKHVASPIETRIGSNSGRMLHLMVYREFFVVYRRSKGGANQSLKYSRCGTAQTGSQKDEVHNRDNERQRCSDLTHGYVDKDEGHVR